MFADSLSSHFTNLALTTSYDGLHECGNMLVYFFQDEFNIDVSHYQNTDSQDMWNSPVFSDTTAGRHPLHGISERSLRFQKCHRIRGGFYQRASQHWLPEQALCVTLSWRFLISGRRFLGSKHSIVKIVVAPRDVSSQPPAANKQVGRSSFLV